MIDVIHIGYRAFDCVKDQSEGASIILRRADVVLGVLVLKDGDNVFPVRVREVRHTKFGHLTKLER